MWAHARQQGLVDERTMNWKALDIDLRFFDPQGYLLLSKLPRERFVEWFYRFRDLWEETSGIAPERYPAAS